MKQFFFSPQFKKWALTGCLTAALGFSVSHNKHLEGFAAIDMASSTDVLETKLPTEKGVVPVRYFANGSEKITAMVSVLDSEGKVCVTCENKVVTISASFEKNKDDIANLNVLLLKALKAKPTDSDDEKVADRKPRPNVEDSQDFTDSKLSAIVDKCSRRSDKADRLDCESTAFMDLLKKYEDSKDKAKNLDNRKLQSFFTAHIENGLIAQVNDSRRVASLLRKGIELGPDDMDKDPQAMRETVLSQIKSMLGDIPGRYEFLRRRLLTAETNMSNIEAKDTQQIYQQARATNNPSLNTEALLRTQDLQSLLNGISSTNYQGLRDAMALPGVTTMTLDQYYNQFNDYARKLSQSIAANPYDFKIPTTSFDSAVTIADRLSNPSGGAAQIIIVTDGTGNRVGRSGGSYPNITTSAPQIPAGQSNTGVIVFGKPQPLTQEQKAARDQMRAVK